MNVSISELRRVSEMIFDHLDRRGVEAVTIDENLYWTINSDERYNMNASPAELNVGSLQDDQGDLMRVLQGDQDVLAAHLQPLSSMLDVLGFVLAERLAPKGG